MAKERIRVVIAPDSYKGALFTDQVAAAIARGLKQCTVVEWEVTCVPMADGGEGTGVVVRALGGAPVTAQTESIYGVPRTGYWMRWGRRAIVEAAVGSGYVPPSERLQDGEHTTSGGTGLLVAQALADPDVDEVFVALGGTGSTDGGMGFLQALGAEFLDVSGRPLHPWGANLDQVAQYISMRNPEKPVIGLYDVGVPLLGPRGAVHQFGPQKGIAPERLVPMDDAMAHYAGVMHGALDTLADVPGAGAAGGMGFGILALGGRLQSGAQTLAEWSNLDWHIAQTDWVITGEGQIDAQTTEGKVVAWVLQSAQQHQKPVIALVGSRRGDLSSLHRRGLAFTMPIGLGPTNLQEAIRTTAESLLAAGEELGWLLGWVALKQ